MNIQEAEIDPTIRGCYIRLIKNAKIARTISDGDGSAWTVDLDKDGQIIGIELIGWVGETPPRE